MSLPDLSRLAAASSTTLRGFGRKLTAMGLDVAAAAPIVNAVAHLDPAVRRPARTFFLRQRTDAVGVALRSLLFEDRVTLEEARLAFGDMTDELLELGLLERSEAGVVSPFVLGIVDDLYFLSDVLRHAGDAVMGLGETSVALGRAVVTRRRFKRALDLGCGAGLGALLLARSATTVVATDLNERAVALARINAAINGVTNVDLRAGDRFAPVEGERFDLIASQPPFVPRPEGIGEASALYGGARGDEIALSILGDLPRHLAPGGRAVLMVQWAETGDARLEDRLRAALGPALNLLILRAPPSNVVADATGYAAGLHPDLGLAFDRDVRARLEHLGRAGIRELTPTLVIVERSADVKGTPGAAWTETVPIESMANVLVTSERIDRMLAARALVREERALLAARLRVPDGTVLAQTQVGPGAEVPSTLSARFSAEAAARSIDLSMELLFLVTIVHEAPSVQAALPRCAEVLEVSLAEARAKVLAAVSDAIRAGLLEVA